MFIKEVRLVLIQGENVFFGGRIIVQGFGICFKKGNYLNYSTISYKKLCLSRMVELLYRVTGNF